MPTRDLKPKGKAFSHSLLNRDTGDGSSLNTLRGLQDGAIDAIGAAGIQSFAEGAHLNPAVQLAHAAHSKLRSASSHSVTERARGRRTAMRWPPSTTWLAVVPPRTARRVASGTPLGRHSAIRSVSCQGQPKSPQL